MKAINSINILTKTLVLTASLIASAAHAECRYNDFQGWKDCFVQEKLSSRLGSVDAEVLRDAKFTPRAVELDRKQPEKKLSFPKYLKIIGIDQKVAAGQKFYNENRELVNSIAEEFNIEPQIIVALLGIESHYGTIMGNFNVVDTLATLSYEGRRKKFFEAELIKLLTMARNEGLGYHDFKGSWAGAMGMCQFMPSSYLAFAVDHDGDGKGDIWNSNEDALASAANYLIKNNWQKGNSSVESSVQLNRPDNCSSSEQICSLDSDYRLIFLKDGVTIEPFRVGRNFDVLMKWNRSLYFGLAVLMIADRIN